MIFSGQESGLWGVATLSYMKRSHYWGKVYCTGWSMRRKSLCGLGEARDYIRKNNKLLKCKRCSHILEGQNP